MIQLRFHIQIPFAYPVAGDVEAIDNALYDLAEGTIELFTDVVPGGIRLTAGPMTSLEDAERLEHAMLATLAIHGCMLLEGAC